MSAASGTSWCSSSTRRARWAAHRRIATAKASSSSCSPTPTNVGTASRWSRSEGDRAEVVLRPTGSVEIARARLVDLAVGGTTPLADALSTPRWRSRPAASASNSSIRSSCSSPTAERPSAATIRSPRRTTSRRGSSPRVCRRSSSMPRPASRTPRARGRAGAKSPRRVRALEEIEAPRLRPVPAQIERPDLVVRSGLDRRHGHARRSTPSAPQPPLPVCVSHHRRESGSMSRCRTRDRPPGHGHRGADHGGISDHQGVGVELCGFPSARRRAGQGARERFPSPGAASRDRCARRPNAAGSPFGDVRDGRGRPGTHIARARTWLRSASTPSTKAVSAAAPLGPLHAARD